MKRTRAGSMATYVLDSGREVFDGPIGIGDVWIPALTDAERTEIATEMVRQWIAWGWPAGNTLGLASMVAKLAAPGYCAMCDDGRPHKCQATP